MVDKTEFIWMNGEFVNWEDAKVHILTHSLHYGTAVMEGVRVYDTELGPALFRVHDYVEIFLKSARKLQMKITYTVDEIVDIIRQSIKKNELKSCYVRLIAYFGYGNVGLNISNCPVNFSVIAWAFDSSNQKKIMDAGVRVKLGNYKKHKEEIYGIRFAGNYPTRILSKMDAVSKGFDEAILLGEDGRMIEGTSENFFMVKGNKIIEPEANNTIRSIMTASVYELAEELGYEVSRREIFKEDFEKSTEAFLVGTNSMIVPIIQFGSKIIGLGKKGQATSHLQDELNKIIKGSNEKFNRWLTYV